MKAKVWLSQGDDEFEAPIISVEVDGGSGALSVTLREADSSDVLGLSIYNQGEWRHFRTIEMPTPEVREKARKFMEEEHARQYHRHAAMTGSDGAEPGNHGSYV